MVEPTIDTENKSYPTRIIGLVLFFALSFFFGLFILPQKIEMVRFIEFVGERDVVWSNIDQIEDWDTWEEICTIG